MANETSWGRAVRDIKRTVGEPAFFVTDPVSALFFGSLSAANTHQNHAIDVWRAIEYGIVGLAIPWVIVIVFQRLKAPGRQRDDLEKELATKRDEVVESRHALEVARLSHDISQEQAIRHAIYEITQEFLRLDDWAVRGLRQDESWDGGGFATRGTQPITAFGEARTFAFRSDLYDAHHAVKLVYRQAEEIIALVEHYNHNRGNTMNDPYYTDGPLGSVATMNNLKTLRYLIESAMPLLTGALALING